MTATYMQLHSLYALALHSFGLWPDQVSALYFTAAFYLRARESACLRGCNLDNDVGEAGAADALDIELQGQHAVELARGAVHGQTAIVVDRLPAEAGAIVEALCRTQSRSSFPR